MANYCTLLIPIPDGLTEKEFLKELQNTLYPITQADPIYGPERTLEAIHDTVKEMRELSEEVAAMPRCYHGNTLCSECGYP